ncbi:MAG: Druantia anti-phage system protein DruA, partial [Pyrinomonadaceae bacterium]
YALTNWSVPVSAGYGRRLRFLVFDKQNEKLIGVFGLCDPLIGSVIRDNFIGWNREQKLERLYNCLTAYILGAVPPYNKILGSKLVALTTMFPKIRKIFREKYKNNQTVISGKSKLPELAFIDTYGAFEKSAIYTRLLNWKFVNYTQGQSHIHLTANGSWETIKKFVPKEIFKTYKYGNGSNWKIRTLRVGLENLGFNQDLLSIGWKRAYYVCPLAKNWREFLTMQDKKPKFLEYDEKHLINEWRNRWVNDRLEKLQTNLNISPEII